MTTAPRRRASAAAALALPPANPPDTHGANDPAATEATRTRRFSQPDWTVEQGLPVARVERRPGYGRTPWWWVIALNERVIDEADRGFRGADEAWAAGQSALRAILAGRFGAAPPV